MRASERFAGNPVTRVDGQTKVTGPTKFIDVLQPGPALLHGVLVESPHAHASILSIETSEAQKVPGVVRVVTGKDLPYKYGLYMKDRFIFPTDKVRFVGEQVAAVIARDARTAKLAATDTASSMSSQSVPQVSRTKACRT